MIRLKRIRGDQHIHKDFFGDGLLKKVLKLASARIQYQDAMKFEGELECWSNTKGVLKAESFDKCAYCEANAAAVSHGDVDHFRPKSIYWWLALCVDNYVYSCQICNQTYKRKKFPISGKPLQPPLLPARIPRGAPAARRLAETICPDPTQVDDADLLRLWLDEGADLPHPYLEDPEPLFEWAVVETNAEVHLVEPPQGTERAKRAVRAAIDYLGLNRETLLRLRYSIYVHLRAHLGAWSQRGDTDAERLVKTMCQSNHQFAGMCRYFAKRAGFKI